MIPYNHSQAERHLSGQRGKTQFLRQSKKWLGSDHFIPNSQFPVSFCKMGLRGNADIVLKFAYSNNSMNHLKHHLSLFHFTLVNVQAISVYWKSSLIKVFWRKTKECNGPSLLRHS